MQYLTSPYSDLFQILDKNKLSQNISSTRKSQPAEWPRSVYIHKRRTKIKHVWTVWFFCLQIFQECHVVKQPFNRWIFFFFFFFSLIDFPPFLSQFKFFLLFLSFFLPFFLSFFFSFSVFSPSRILPSNKRQADDVQMEQEGSWTAASQNIDDCPWKPVWPARSSESKGV